jgi:phage baseplate assembly protein gpV
MDTENLFVAKVINNFDIKKEGRVQIYVQSIMENWKPQHYPFARYISGSGISNIHEIGDTVWVFCEKPNLKKNWYVLGTFEESNTNPHNKYTNPLLSSAKYPNLKYMKLDNGLTIGMSSSISSPEIFVDHPFGTSILINDNGEVKIKVLNGTCEFEMDKMGKVKLKTYGEIILDGDTVIEKDVKMKGDVKIEGDLKVEGEVKCDSDIKAGTISLMNHTHTGNLGLPTSPPT